MGLGVAIPSARRAETLTPAVKGARARADTEAMLDRLRRVSVRLDPAGRMSMRSDAERTARVAELGRAVRVLAGRPAASDARALDVQVVVQISDAAGYGRWKADRERTWRRQGGRFTTASWPRALTPEGSGAVLLPLPAGRSSAPGREPKAVASPLFTTDTSGDHEDVVLRTLVRWAAAPGTERPVRLAAPVLEIVRGGRVAERRVVGFGLDWPLQA